MKLNLPSCATAHVHSCIVAGGCRLAVIIVAAAACMPISWLCPLSQCALLVLSGTWFRVICTPCATAPMPQHPCPLLQYGERLPIGKESVITGVPASVVKGFYERWYRPEVRPGVTVHPYAPELPRGEACVHYDFICPSTAQCLGLGMSCSISTSCL